MMLKRLFSHFAQSTARVRNVRSAAVAIWALVLVTLAPGCALEIPGQAQSPAPGAGAPEIVLEPSVASVGTIVTVRGEGWNDGSMVLIYLVAPNQTEPPNYAAAGATADAEGRFTIEFVVPSEPGWESQGLAMVIARAAEDGAIARALFSTESLGAQLGDAPQSANTPVAPTPEPIVTPPHVSEIPIVTAQPGIPTATATTDLNIRGGPGTGYPVLGLLRAGQSAKITGVSADRGWWQIEFSGAADERGWVSARYVSAENTGDVPVVQSPSLPPAAVSDWRGEYYSNRHLSGAPTLVRNDVAVNFDWGVGAPAAEMSADNFSARWSRTVNFSGGTYRFYAHVDDGVRLWVDEALVIDQWHDSAPTTYSADVYLTDGIRSLKMEYYELTGDALAQLAWERLETYPDWKGEYFNNPDLGGAPVLVRNDVGIGFDWGPNSPGPGVPADNFSARWSRSLHFKAGAYRFKLVVDDGARLWVDEFLVIDRWQAGDPKGYTAEVTLTEGTHNLRLEYFEYRYDAQVHLTWERVDGYPDWKGEYYDNRKLEGSPILVRNDSSINFNWETGSPGPRVPADSFSVRWTRAMDFESGTYVFSIWVDDGVRLWIDDKLVIDGWQDGSTRLLQAEGVINGGAHRVRVEYYERGGAAQIAVNWSRKQESTNQPPQAVPGGPYIVDEGSPITLDGSGSKDPDGSIVKYEWDFNYDGRAFIVGAVGDKASTRYADGPATFTIALRVTDNKGANQIASAQVKVENVAPTVEAGGPYIGQVGAPISMAGTATDPGSVDQAGLKYDWDFGDGTQGSGPIVGHSYAAPRDYILKLTVTDKDGAQGSDTATVQVAVVNQPSTAIISGPTHGLVGETLRFSGNGSSDPDGSIISYAWDFGDGSQGDGPSVSHAYDLPGDYRVTLTVTDDGGLRNRAALSIHIARPAPMNQPPTAVISGPTSGLVGETLNLDGSGSNDLDGSVVGYDWNFGDGNTGSGVIVTHVYTQAGSYQVTLTVTDDGGLTASAIYDIQIEPASGKEEV
jgi:PKD repeat protein